MYYFLLPGLPQSCYSLVAVDLTAVPVLCFAAGFAAGFAANLSFTAVLDLLAKLVFWSVAGFAAIFSFEGVADLLAVDVFCPVVGVEAALVAVVLVLLEVLKLVPSAFLF